MAQTHGSAGRVLTVAGTSASFTNQACTHISTYQRYQITSAAYRYLDPFATTTVQTSPDNSTWTTVTSGYTIEYAGGYVVFDSPLSAGTYVRFSAGKYYTPIESVYCSNWKMDISADQADITTFSSGGYKAVLPGLKEIGGSIEAFWNDGAQLTTLAAGQLMYFILYTDYGTNKYRYEGYGYLKKDAVEVAVDDVAKESVDFSLLRAYWRAG